MTDRALVGYRDRNRRIHYYVAMDGRTCRAVRGEKKEAARFTPDAAQRVVRQLAALDNRGWQVAMDRPRCRFPN